MNPAKINEAVCIVRAIAALLERWAPRLPARSAIHLHLNLYQMFMQRLDQANGPGGPSDAEDADWLGGTGGSSFDSALWFNLGFLDPRPPGSGAYDFNGIGELDLAGVSPDNTEGNTT